MTAPHLAILTCARPQPHLTRDLSSRLEQIQHVFDVAAISRIAASQEYVQRYYEANRFAYSLFHTRTDRMYIGISRRGSFEDADLLEAARTVERYLVQLSATNVLELATGRGATAEYLARRFRDVVIEGIDISSGQLTFAFRRAKAVRNYIPAFGDFHDLGRFSDRTFDLVFVIEALCYSQRKERVFEEVYRVLAPGGVFIIFDGHARRDAATLTAEEALAKRLTERGMAVAEFENVSGFLTKIRQSPFTVIHHEDVSPYIMPTLERFEKLARGFFSRPALARAVTTVFPQEFLYNAVSGLLMPITVRLGIFCYHITVLQKPVGPSSAWRTRHPPQS